MLGNIVLKTFGAALIATSALIALPVSPASAATTLNFGPLQTEDRAGDDGYAWAEGTITFVDANSIKWSSSIGDRCGGGDGDGRGAYLYIYIYYMNGGQERQNINLDNNGCGTGNIVKSSPGAYSSPSDGNIKRVRFQLVESDGPVIPGDSTDWSVYKDNPYT
jgi:hypothetical protein